MGRRPFPFAFDNPLRQLPRMFKHAAFTLLLALAIVRPIRAADEPPKKDDKPADATKDKSKDKDAEKLTESRHKVTIAGRDISYAARAGVIQLKDAEDKPTASIFHIAYTRDDTTNAAARPLTFSFNGGPGSS
jgi:carboxypeptidase C (cathepsin A)